MGNYGIVARDMLNSVEVSIPLTNYVKTINIIQVANKLHSMLKISNQHGEMASTELWPMMLSLKNLPLHHLMEGQ